MAVNGVEAAIINRTPQPEEYIPLILFPTDSDDYEKKEAVKAQAVIARTIFSRKIQEKNISDVLGISGEIKKKNCVFFRKKSEKAAEETRGRC